MTIAEAQTAGTPKTAKPVKPCLSPFEAVQQLRAAFAEEAPATELRAKGLVMGLLKTTTVETPAWVFKMMPSVPLRHYSSLIDASVAMLHENIKATDQMALDVEVGLVSALEELVINAASSGHFDSDTFLKDVFYAVLPPLERTVDPLGAVD